MAKYKKSIDHLTNAGLAAPFAFIAGGPVGAAAVLGLGKLLDHIEDVEFEKRQAEWQNNPHRYVAPTMEQIQQKNIKSREMSQRINDLPFIQNAKGIRACADWRQGHQRDTYVTISGGRPLEYSRTGIGDGEVWLHDGVGNSIPNRKVPATLYYNEEDFFNQIVRDYRSCPGMEIWKINASGYKQGHWMYTMDNGRSYVVGL